MKACNMKQMLPKSPAKITEEQTPRREDVWNVSADAYMNEPVKYPALCVTNLKEEGANVADSYRNMVINRINGSCLRLAVFEGEYSWHYHPTSDELFIVVEGNLAIDLEEGRELLLGSWESVTIPANTIHRTRAIGRTVNLCFEELGAETVFIDRAAKLAVAPKPAQPT